MPRLKRVVEQSDTSAGKIFDLSIQALIFLSLVTFSIETLPNLSPTMRLWLRRIEVVCVVLFSMEYALRTWVATPPGSYLFSVWGIIDLAAILPFYLGLGIDLRSLRTLRMLRLFRILKLARYSAATRRFHRALNIAREELILFLSVTTILIYLAAVGIYYFENSAQPEAFASIFHSLWWSVVTLTTVGYGDVYPITAGGRMFTFVLLLLGLGIVSVPAGLLASALGKARQLEDANDDAQSSEDGP